jgi:DNA polymerase III epsilon subunit-like protein
LKFRSKILNPERNLNNELSDVIFFGYRDKDQVDFDIDINLTDNTDNEIAEIIKNELRNRHFSKLCVELNQNLKKCSVVYFCHYNKYTQLDTHYYYDFDNEFIKEIILNNSGSIICQRFINSNYFLIFDTETTGIPKDWHAPISNSSNWPRLVQIAWTLLDCEKSYLDKKNFIIKPSGFEIPLEASKIHKITTAYAINNGVDLITVLNQFNEAINKCSHIIAHNIDFDEKIVKAEFYRCGIQNNIDNKTKICTMKISTDYCAISGPYGFKWPKLEELYKKLFSENFIEAHNAEKDLEATQRCFWKMKEIGII